MARVVNTSATYLSRHFKQATGLSYVDYIGRVRVEKAKLLLQDSSLRISAIALEVGFRSLSQFNRSFRRVTGRAPRELRTP
jgi:AraC-like DNA-binding protein